MSNRFSISAVVEHYTGNPVPPGRRYVKVSCPVGTHEDKEPSATINESKGSAKCFSCGWSGDAIALIQEREGVDYGAAVGIAESIAGHEDPGVPRAASEPGRRRPTRLLDGGEGVQPGNDRALHARRRAKPRRLG